MRSLMSSLLALMLVVLATSCASGSRLWRMSPMGSKASADRVNLWPLVHTSGDGTAVAWPLFDVDDKGFALRPLIAKDGPQWEVLYPLASHNTKTGNGWAVPFYWIGDSKGLFPIMHFGAFSFVGPFFWKDEAGDADYGGLFPIAFFGELNFIGPFWWSGKSGSSGGLFPLIQYGKFNYIGPVWWNRDTGGFGVFPLFGTASTRHIGPVWWERTSDGRGSWGLFPLVWSYDNNLTFTFLPFYSHEFEGDSRTRNYLLGLAHTHKSARQTRNWVLPFYYEHERGEDRDSALLPFYWKRKRGDETQVFTLLGNRRVEDDGGSFNVYPLWWSSHTANSSSKLLMPFFYYEADGDDRTLLTPLGGHGWSASGASRYTNVLGPIYHHSASSDGHRERTAILWPLFEREREGAEVTTRSMPFFSHTSVGDRSEGWYAGGLGHYLSSPGESMHRLWPLYSVADQTDLQGLFYDLTLWGTRRSATIRRHWLFPLFWAETSGADFETSALLGTLGYTRRGDAQSWRVWPLASSTVDDGNPEILHWTTLFGRLEEPGYEGFHLLTPFVFVHSSRNSADARSSSTRLFSVFASESSEKFGAVIPSQGSFSRENMISSSAQTFLFGLIANVRETFRVWRAGAVTDAEARHLASYSKSSRAEFESGVRDDDRTRRILAAHGRTPTGVDSATLRAEIESFTAENTEIVERHRSRFPLLWNYERKGESLEWSGPLWLASSKSKPGSSRFNVLFYGYRSETDGDQTRRDIFPFITWDSAPQASKVSFLWRLFRYETRGEKSGGHVLFIPWGDV